jgi:hypothetical protein
MHGAAAYGVTLWSLEILGGWLFKVHLQDRLEDIINGVGHVWLTR